MSVDAAHTKGWQSSEVTFGVPFLASIVLQLILPIDIPRTYSTLFIIIGSVLIGAGLVFIVLARREFARHNQPTNPGRPTSSIVISGIYSVSRNPLYLGAACLFLGIAMVARLTWFFILFIPTLIACHYILIAPEEQYLAAKFSDEYTSYAAKVHRWIGRRAFPNQRQDTSAH